MTVSGTHFRASETLRKIALEQPATIRVFERYNLDYCCGGRRPLNEACTAQGLEVDAVLTSLEEAVQGAVAAEQDFTSATATELIRHIVATHHAFVRRELLRLLPMAEKVAAKHGPAHPETAQIEDQLQRLAEELIFHLKKEERVLFPYIEALESFQAGVGKAPQACFAAVESPIAVMINEHETAGTLLARMRAATGDFTPWEGSCPTVTGLYHGLDEFERDLHRHVHLENNLLFPRAIALETVLRVVH